jgi:hypothetical protein
LIKGIDYKMKVVKEMIEKSRLDMGAKNQ